MVRTIILTQLFISMMIFTFGCGSSNDFVNDVIAVEGTKLLTLQSNFLIDKLRSGDAETVAGKACSERTLAVGGGCVVRSVDGGKAVQSPGSFLNQESQAFTCIVENNSREDSFDILVTIQTMCSDIN